MKDPRAFVFSPHQVIEHCHYHACDLREDDVVYEVEHFHVGGKGSNLQEE